MKRLAMLTALLLLLAGCSQPDAAGAPEGLTVIATNFAGYDFARQAVGDYAAVSMLLPPGAESHSFEPTPQDIIRIGKCDIFLYVGGESEHWVEAILDSIGTGGVRVLSMMEMVDVYQEELVEGMEHGHEPGAAHGDGETAYDEHVWTSPVNAGVIVEAVGDALAALDPGHAETYRENAASYAQRLGELDGKFRAAAAAGARRTLIFGDRFPFRYFVEEYGLDYYAAFPGCSADTEPSAATVAFLIDKVREEKIPVVLHIEFSNEQMARTICDETGAEPLLLHSCHNVTAEEFAGGVTYLDLMEGNLVILKEALR